jgi:hypothetical protein
MVLKDSTRRFIEVLRLGKYKQITGRLHAETPPGEDCGYCWAGVACDLYMRSEGKGHWDELGRFVLPHSNEITGVYEATHEGDMPPEVMEWLGLDDVTTEAFIAANDESRTFPQLADSLEYACTHYVEELDLPDVALGHFNADRQGGLITWH